LISLGESLRACSRISAAVRSMGRL
jgi:hypothetical protein